MNNQTIANNWTEENANVIIDTYNWYINVIIN